MCQTITACLENCSGQNRGSTYTSVTRDAYLALRATKACMRVSCLEYSIIGISGLEKQSCERLTKACPDPVAKGGFVAKFKFKRGG